MMALAAKHLYPLLLVVSLLSSILFGALLMAWHAPLAGPLFPAASPAHTANKAHTANPAYATGQPRRMLHFLSPHCKCSERLAQYLSSRPPHENLVESVVLLGDGASSTLPQDSLPRTLDSLRRLGYGVHISGSELSSNRPISPPNSSQNKVSPSNGVLSSAARQVPGGPWLLIEDQDGRVEYSGGYEVAPYWEARILYAVQNRYVQASLPASGCAASTKLRARNFALRLKDLINTL